MTNEEAIGRIRDHMDHHGIGHYPHLKIKEALDLAISALQSVGKDITAPTKNDHFRDFTEMIPLTLEQLREMIGDPVYLYIYDTALDSGWHIIKAVTEDKIIFRGWNTVYVPIDGMGIDYNLYRRPPEGEEREA